MSVDYYYYVFGSTNDLTTYVTSVLYEKMPEAQAAFYRNGEPRVNRLGIPPEVFVNTILATAKEHLKFVKFWVGAIGEDWNDHKVVTISNGKVMNVTDIVSKVREIVQDGKW